MTREDLLSRISIQPNVCFGKPCIRGTRIWVSLVLDLLATGSTTAELLQEYPQLKEDDIRACLLYGAEAACPGRGCRQEPRVGWQGRASVEDDSGLESRAAGALSRSAGEGRGGGQDLKCSGAGRRRESRSGRTGTPPDPSCGKQPAGSQRNQTSRRPVQLAPPQPLPRPARRQG